MSEKNLELERVIALRGGLAGMARALEVSPQRVNNWRRRGLPVEWAVKIGRVMSEITSPDALRPDIF